MIDFNTLPESNYSALNCGGFAAKTILDFFGQTDIKMPDVFYQEYCKMSDVAALLRCQDLQVKWCIVKHKNEFTFEDLRRSDIFMLCGYEGAPYWDDAKHFEIVTGMDGENRMTFLTLPYQYAPTDFRQVNFMFVGGPESDISTFVKTTVLQPASSWQIS